MPSSCRTWWHLTYRVPRAKRPDAVVTIINAGRDRHNHIDIPEKLSVASGRFARGTVIMARPLSQFHFCPKLTWLGRFQIRRPRTSDGLLKLFARDKVRW